MNNMVSSGAHSHSEAIAGKWHLVDEVADEVHVPLHRLDLMFHSEGGRLRGAILNRINGQEIPLASLQFDGSVLRLQMQAQEGKTQAEMPMLVMRTTHDKFEGCWMNSATERLGPNLKLVKAKP